MSSTPTADVITTTWRQESATLVAALTRMTRDVGLAEDLAQDALVAALEQWPDGGVPRNPGAWLMTTAKRRAIDHFRRADTLRRKTDELGHRLDAETKAQEHAMPDLESQVDHIEDDVLRLIFLCCHPALTPDSRAALTLRLVGGLTTARDRPRVPGRRVQHGPADLAGQAHAERVPGRVRAAHRRRPRPGGSTT